MLHDATGVLIARRFVRRLCSRSLALVVCIARRRRVRRRAARAPRRPADRGIDVVQIEGYFDSPNSRSMRDSIEHANATGSTAARAPGEVVGCDRRRRARHRPRHRPVASADYRLGRAVGCRRQGRDHAAAARPPTSRSSRRRRARGPGNPVLLDEPGASIRPLGGRPARGARTEARSRSRRRARRLADRARSARQEASDVGATNGVRPTIGELIVRLDGKTVTTKAGEIKLSTAKVIGTGRDRRRQPNQVVRFSRLGLGGQLLHRLISPSIAYFLLIAGLALLVFEFYTARCRPRGPRRRASARSARSWASRTCRCTGGRSACCSSRDVRVLRRRPGRLVGVWTVIGTVRSARAPCSCTAARRSCGPPWWVLLVVGLGMVLFMVGGMTAMVRSRFSTPTIGREGMIGEAASAEVAGRPRRRGADPGRAVARRTNRATPLAAGAEARGRRRRGPRARGGATRGRSPRLPGLCPALQE